MRNLSRFNGHMDAVLFLALLLEQGFELFSQRLAYECAHSPLAEVMIDSELL